MKHWLIAYGAALVVFLVVDLVWLGVVARSFYAEQLGRLMRPDVQRVAAALFYFGFVAGLVFLAVRPGQPDWSVWQAAAQGAVVGLLAYGTYDLTNWATLRDWPVAMSLVDMLWGTALSATVAGLSRLVLEISA